MALPARPRILRDRSLALSSAKGVTVEEDDAHIERGGSSFRLLSLPQQNLPPPRERLRAGRMTLPACPRILRDLSLALSSAEGVTVEEDEHPPKGKNSCPWGRAILPPRAGTIVVPLRGLPPPRERLRAGRMTLPACPRILRDLSLALSSAKGVTVEEGDAHIERGRLSFRLLSLPQQNLLLGLPPPRERLRVGRMTLPARPRILRGLSLALSWARGVTVEEDGCPPRRKNSCPWGRAILPSSRRTFRRQRG